jgi:hypothetical protein
MKQLITFLSVCLLIFSCSVDGALDENPGSGIPGSITKFAVYNGYLYGLNQNEVQTYSLADPNKPILVHKLPTDYGLETITIYDGTPYIGSSTSLYILDISTPSAPKIASKTDRIESFSGCDPVVVKGDYAYSTIKIIANICGNLSAESQLIVFDVNDKTKPQMVTAIPMNMPNGLGLKGDYLFVCDEGTDKIQIFDITEQDNPKPTLFDVPLPDPVDLIVTGNTLIASTKSSFVVYDITNIAQIRQMATIGK